VVFQERGPQLAKKRGKKLMFVCYSGENLNFWEGQDFAWLDCSLSIAFLLLFLPWCAQPSVLLQSDARFLPFFSREALLYSLHITCYTVGGLLGSVILIA
jgi:hypothetical protein